MDGGFLEGVRDLYDAGAGTEARAWSLYSLVRTLRPTHLLEVGAGYTTLFLLRAMADNVASVEEERRRLGSETPPEAGRRDGHERRPTPDPAGVLDPAFFADPHEPRLLACDVRGDRLEEIAAVAESLELDSLLEIRVGDFRDLPGTLGPDAPRFDLVFFDCGGPEEYVDFLRDFWNRIDPRGGLLALDFTWWCRRVMLADGTVRTMRLPGSILNEIERQRQARGREGGFEVLTLVEPHKLRQGSLTLLRRLPSEAAIRDIPLRRDLELLAAKPVDTTFELD